MKIMNNTHIKIALALSLTALVSACGGSGGGHDDRSRNTVQSVTTNGFTITEDQSLNENLSGVWVENSELTFANEYVYSSYSISTHGTETGVMTLVIVEDANGGLYINNCFTEATNIEISQNSVAFNLGDLHYVLNRNSNTHLSGELSYSRSDNTEVPARTSSGNGQTTLFKAGAGPASTDELLENFNIGLLRYSRSGAPEQLMEIQCLANFHGNEATDNDESVAIEYDVTRLSTFLGDFVTFVDHSEYGQMLQGYVGDDAFYMAVNSDDDYIHFNFGGTDTITLDIDASADSYYDASSDSFTGSATIDF